jgi:hypothetical protein
MDDVTAGMADLRGRMTALAPAAGTGTDGSHGALTWGAALVYGLARALGLRWAAQFRFVARREPAAQEATAAPARRARPGQVSEQRRAALTGRRGGVSR